MISAYKLIQEEYQQLILTLILNIIKEKNTIMLSNNNIPTRFQIISSSQDNLFIKYYLQNGCGCVTVILLWFVFVFIGHVGSLFLGLYHILHLKFWQALQDFSYGKDNLLNIFLFIFTLLLSGALTHYWLWIIWGVTEFKADQQKLIIIKKLLIFSIKYTVLKENIYYFLQEKLDKEYILPYKLKIITNQRIYEKEIKSFFNIPVPEYIYYKQIQLLDTHSIEESNWLGKLLADFYEVEFRPANKNT